MPRLPRTADLVAALDVPGAAMRCGALVKKHGRAALRDARGDHTARLVLPRIYAHNSHVDSFDARVTAAMTWLPHTVALTGLAACAVYGLLEDPPERIRAAAPSPLHVRSPRWLTLRRCVVPSLRREHEGTRVVSLPEALVHAWEEDPNGAARDAIFTALRKGKTSVSEIREALSYYPWVRGGARLRAFLRHLLDGMHSYLEYRGAQTVLNTPDLSRLAYQTKFVIEGNVFYADRYDPKTRTSVEFDSMRWHGSAEARQRDKWRDALFRSAGIEPVHLLSTDVFRRPAWCRKQVRAALAARAGPP